LRKMTYKDKGSYESSPPCITCESVMLNVNQSCYMSISHVICELVMSHVWRTHFTPMNESCHAYERVKSHTWMCHITYINKSCHTYECVMSHIWMRHVTNIKELRHTYKSVMSHIRIRSVTHFFQFRWHMLKCIIHETWLIHIWDMTHS